MTAAVHPPAHGPSRPGPVRRSRVLAAALLIAMLPGTALAQQTAGDVLEFLLTPRSIDTGDTGADAEAAAAVHAAIAGSFVAALPRPVSTSAGGFAFHIDSTLGGAPVRTSASFGAFFTDRALTAGRGRGSVDVSYGRVQFDTLDGRDLRNGRMLVTATRAEGQEVPADVESLALRLDVQVTTLSATYGLSDRLDLAAAVPLLKLAMRGLRIDTFRGTQAVVSRGEANVSGLGDLEVRAKYALLRQASSSAAFTAAVRLPTGSDEDLLGSGDVTVHPGLVWSFERERVAIDGAFGLGLGPDTSELAFGGAFTFIATPRVMAIAEVSGRRLSSVWRSEPVVTPMPHLPGLETVRLSAVEGSATHARAAAGVKWNPSGAWVISGHVRRRLTTSGLTAGWAPGATLEYIIGR